MMANRSLHAPNGSQASAAQRHNPAMAGLTPRGRGAGQRHPGAPMSDQKAKTVLKEAVDAVVNSFAKHTHGYGRGKNTGNQGI